MSRCSAFKIQIQLLLAYTSFVIRAAGSVVGPEFGRQKQGKTRNTSNINLGANFMSI